MDRLEAKERIEQLRGLLNEYNRLYYIENAPVISDFEFDKLMHELEELERSFPEYSSPDSPSQRVGSDIKQGSSTKAKKEGFVQKKHKYPMLSLGNTYSIAEVIDFAQRAEKGLEEGFSYCCELKFDGVAICLSYENGRLVQALTRGDGEKGDDVSINALQISNIPLTLHGDFPPSLEIRGEVLMPYDAFRELNKQRELDGEQAFANPRNAASGSLKLLNPDEVKRRGLYCTLYHIPAQSVDFPTHSQALEKAASWGLPISKESKICKNIEEVRAYIEYWDKARANLPFATDGIVIKINELSAQRELGYTAKFPRWAVAYKFKAEQACTKLESIDYQVGRTGAVTPVANLQAVQLAGTVVKRATLNNEEQMALLDIRIGDYVKVEKGGEIIPKITGVELSLRGSDVQVPRFPEHCPDCGSKLVKEEGEARWFCPNADECPMQIKGRIEHFVSRKAMDILAGEATIDQFYQLGLIHSPADLYDIKINEILALEGWQQKSATRFLDSLQQSKNIPFSRVLYALGIRHVGESTAKELALSFSNIDKLISASKEELLSIKDIGEVIAESIISFFKEEKHLIEIERLKAHGLQFDLKEQVSSQKSSILEGKIIVVSGNFSESRDRIKELIELHGGKNSSSISGKTSFLLAGQKAGPEKLKKCESLGIKIIDEAIFREMIGSEEEKEEKVAEKKAEFIQLELF